MKRLLAILSIFVVFGLSAQEVKLDTLKIRQILADSTLTLSPLDNDILPRYNFQDNSRYDQDDIDTTIPDIVPTNIDIPTSGQSGIVTWQNGGAVAAGSSQDLPGMMGIENGTVSLYQNIGNWTIGVGGEATKYGYFRGLNTQYGLNGMLSYRFNSNNSATLFGNYYFGGMPNTNPTLGATMTPAMIGYYNATRIGGYVSHDFSRSWGIDLGAQTYQRLGSSQWDVAPIVAPYFKTNNGQKISVDVGGIIYNILHNASGKQLDWGRGNPTMAPPKMGLGAIGH